jgi:opacity protein-like surface antigen
MLLDLHHDVDLNTLAKLRLDYPAIKLLSSLLSIIMVTTLHLANKSQRGVFMKRIFYNTAILPIVLLFSSTGYSKSIPMVYGLENASHFNSHVQQDFYIQAGSFLYKKNAENEKIFLQTKIPYPIVITHSDRFYRVIIGPLASSFAVRQAAQSMVTKPLQHTTPAWAKPIPAMSSKTNWYLGIGAGNQFSNFNTTMTVNNNSGAASPYDQDIYSLKRNNTQAVVTLSAGHRWERNRTWFPAYSVGAFYQHSVATNPGNTVTQYSTPDFTNYTYNLNVSSNLLLGLFKLNLVKWGRVSPYLLTGIGGAFNRTCCYGETPIAGLTAVRASPGYQGNTTGQFAYMGGAGFDFRISRHFLFSTEYQYQNLGHVMTGPGAEAWSGQSLHLGTYHTNTLLLNLIYLIEK